MKKALNRLFIYAFVFVLGGGAGSGLFYLWAYGQVFHRRSQFRDTDEWVLSLSIEQLYFYLMVAFGVGGLLAVGWVFWTFLKRDLDMG